MLELKLEENYGTKITLQFKTDIVKTLAALEQRIVNWDGGLLKFDLSKKAIDPEMLEYLVGFHSAVRGRKETFLFKDWSDYRATASPTPHTRGILYKIDDNQYRAYKQYSVGSLNNIYRIYRPIFYLDIDSFAPFQQSNTNTPIEIPEWTIDPLSGIVSFATPPPDNVSLYWSGDFRLPVRFAEDAIEYRLLSYDEENINNDLYTLPQLTLVEVRELAPYNYLKSDFASKLNLNLEANLPIDINISPSFNNSLFSLASGFERRDDNIDTSVASWRVGSQHTLFIEELEYLIALFRVARGRGCRFLYRDKTGYKNSNGSNREKTFPVRFDSDALSYTVESPDCYRILGFDLKELLYEFISITQNIQLTTPLFFQQRPYQFNLPAQLNDCISAQAKVKKVVPFSNNYPESTPSGYFTLNGVTYTGAQLMSLNNLERRVDIPITGVVYVDPSGHYVPMTSLIFTIEWSGIKIVD